MIRRTSTSRFPVSLRQLLPQASFVGCADLRTFEVTSDSRECRPGCLFAAIPGHNADGREYIAEALANGAAGLLVSQPVAEAPVPQCVVPNVRQAYARLCAHVVGQPSQRVRLVGVTGTNGKTTVTWMVRSMLRSAGLQTGLLGTIVYDDGRQSESSQLTTPGPREFNEWLQSMVAAGTTHAAVELSSHALCQDRVAGTQLEVGVVTNITQDHFDYHGNFETYWACKARITSLVRPGGLLVVNANNPASLRVAECLSKDRQVRTFGISTAADVGATVLEESIDGTRFLLNLGGKEMVLQTPLIGRHNLSNALAALTAVEYLGCGTEVIRTGLASLSAVPGRLERIDAGQPFHVFVDYAHTDDALQRVVSFLRPLTAGRLICVFGAGGDRDRSKRPRFARAVQGADLKIVTSDNPRSEDPQQIMADIVRGFDPAEVGSSVQLEVDRRAAIEMALSQAQPGDCVLIAGKGHETEQLTGSERIPFDDRVVAREVLEQTFHTPVLKRA